ncbi:MAG: GDP-mannose 4,6-dehydratase, partial [Mycoplasmataceae bacterium]|nr:GDP-mannose 4,6-dehydratase [Mycoplasmataceae bacterium]
MNILLIGGAGYIGSNVSLLLKNKRPEDFVLILDNFSTGTKQALIPDVEWVCADVRDYNQLNSIFKYKKFDVVMNFSALTVVSESTQKPLEYYEDNFIGTFNILKAMKENNVKNIIFSSTAAVYGNPKEVPIVETSLKDPINPYGNSKLCSEFLIK